MIQELLTAGMVDDNKLSIHPSTTTTTSSSSPHSKITSSSSAMPSEPLRCPRCDSSNTKFCYYNNYNLTQPRHFCKTCRRYWTKGGALRNVPIGGGCRKARAIPTIAAKVAKPPSGDAQIMALLRAAQNPNPNPNLENLGQMQVGLGSSLWRSNGGGQYTCQQLQPLLQRNNSSNSSSSSSMLMGDVPSLGMKWSGNYHNGDQLQAVISNMSGFNSSSAATAAVTTTSAATAASILEQIPLGGGDQFGYWNSALSWSDHLNSANGAFP